MRRHLIPASIVCLALLASCGDDSESSDDSATATTESTVGTNVSTVETTAQTTGPTAAATVESIATATVPSDCPPPDTTDTVAAPTFPDGKPAVEIPAESPTELVITDLIEGSGDAAKAGDIVTVNYVGVRSANGEEFDNSYDRGETFEVTLGAGGVIQGWDEGLIGIKVGGRRQLDIPAELAYGDTPNGDIIQPGDALSFVVDAVSIQAGPPVADPADEPVIEIPISVGGTEVVTEDLVEGDRCLIALPGEAVFVQYVLYRGDTGEQIESSWASGSAAQIVLDSTGVVGLVNGIIGMGVGGRRMIILPPALGFGVEANAQIGISDDTDIVVVIDLIQVD